MGKKSSFDILATLIQNLLISDNKFDDKLSEDFFHLFGRDFKEKIFVIASCLIIIPFTWIINTFMNFFFMVPQNT